MCLLYRHHRSETWLSPAACIPGEKKIVEGKKIQIPCYDLHDRSMQPHTYCFAMPCSPATQSTVTAPTESSCKAMTTPERVKKHVADAKKATHPSDSHRGRCSKLCCADTVHFHFSLPLMRSAGHQVLALDEDRAGMASDASRGSNESHVRCLTDHETWARGITQWLFGPVRRAKAVRFVASF